MRACWKGREERMIFEVQQEGRNLFHHPKEISSANNIKKSKEENYGNPINKNKAGNTARLCLPAVTTIPNRRLSCFSECESRCV